MELADADDEAAVGEDSAVGVPQRVRLARLRGERARCGAGLVDPIEAAVVEARAEDDPAVAEPGAAAVLVHTRADVEVRRNDVGGLTVVRVKDQRTPPALLRPTFGPVDAL